MIKGENREEDGTQSSGAESSMNSAFRCGNCIACFRVSPCEKCPNCVSKAGPCLRQMCVQAGMMAASTEPSSSQPNTNLLTTTERNSKKEESKKKNKLKETKNNAIKKNRLKPRIQLPIQPLAKESSSAVVEIVVPKRVHKPHKPHVFKGYYRGIKKGDEVAQQCCGPNCAKASRPNSKYCSDECGLLLADHRLKYILKGRVTDFYRLQPIAEKSDDKKIRDLTVKKAETESDLEAVSKYVEMFDDYITSLCKTEPQQDSQPQASSSNVQEFSLFCPVCGQDFWSNEFVRHIERCSTDQERKFVYGSKYSLAENPNNIICDQYDPSLQTYCRRLRYSCAEHYNDSLGSRMSTCGYPLIWSDSRSMRLQEMFSNLEDIASSNKVCMRARNQCQEHLRWEQNVRALLDNHRMRLILYLDELATEYFHIFEAYRTRGDALTLLSNSRQLPNEVALKEEADYHGEQTNATVLAQKQEELSVESLYHTIKANRSAAKSASNTSTQTLSTNGLIDSSPLLLNGVNSSEILNLLPLLQNNLQSNMSHSLDSLAAYSVNGETSGLTLRASSCYGSSENTRLGASMEALVKIEQ